MSPPTHPSQILVSAISQERVVERLEDRYGVISVTSRRTDSIWEFIQTTSRSQQGQTSAVVFFFFFCRPDRSHVTSSFVYGLILVRVWRLSLSLIKLDISFHCRLIFKRNKQFLCSHLDVPTLCPPSPHTHTI